jgi:hypothetical protein
VALGPDGAFRLAFPKDSKKGKLHLVSRFLYLDDPNLKLPCPDGPLNLQPELRGILKGRIALGPIAEPRRKALDRTRLSLSSKSWSESPAHKGRSPETRLDPDGNFEFEFVPGAPDWELSLAAGEFADARRSPIAIVPGQVATVELGTQLLAVLRGVVVDTAGAPVASVAFEHAIGGPEPSKQTRLKSKSGADGTFELAGIPLGTGWLISYLPGYVTRPTQLVELAEGQLVDGLKIVLERGHAITGKINWPDGAPAAGAQVSAVFLEDQELGDTRRSVLRSQRTKTDEAGAYRIEGLPQSSLRVIATAATREKSADAPWNAVAELDAPPPGDLRLELARPCMIRGRVHDTEGNPPTNFSLRARPVWRVKLSDGYTSMDSPDDSKSADGSFVLGGLLPITYEVTAAVSGIERSSPQRVELPGSGQPIEIVVVSPGMASGLVVDPSGNAVSGARVKIGELSVSSGVPCDAAGRFRMENLTPGRHSLVASATGWAPSTRLQIEVVPSSPLDSIVLTLRVSSRIAGEVLDSQGKSEPGRPVRLEQSGPDRDTRTDDHGRFLFEDLAVGQYSLCTRATEAELAALPKQSRQRWANSNDPVPREAQVKLGEGESAHVVLRPSSFENPILVKGRVICAGKGVAGCEVSATPMFAGRASPPATSAADGGFQFQVDGPGPYTFSLEPAEPSADTRVKVSIEARGTVDLVLELPASRVSGLVVDGEGRRLGGTRLELRLDGDRGDASVSGMGGSVDADAQGRFEFTHVAPGTYMLIGSNAWDAPTKHGKTKLGGLVVREGAGLADVKFVMLPGCRVEGYARRPDGQPGAGAQVFVREGSGRILSEDWDVDPAGKFVIEDLPPGRYSFQAVGGHMVSPESELIALAETTPTKLELALQNATDLLVQTLKANDSAVYARLELVDASGRTCTNRGWLSDDAGAKPKGTHLGPAPPGKYKLRGRWPSGAALEQEVQLSGEPVLTLTLREPN